MTAPTIALITPSYSGDLERCRLLCESFDQFAEAGIEHLLLVADHDLPLFKDFASTRRRIVPDSALLPRWLLPIKPPFSTKWRWISRNPLRPIRPMSGWHVQQIRKLLVAQITDAPVLVMADSDSVFVRPLCVSQFLQEGKVRLYVRPTGITADSDLHTLHRQWTGDAARILGQARPTFPAPDYINNLVSWRRDLALALVKEIEDRNGKEMPQILANCGTFSEYQLYGAFATQRATPDQHFASEQALSLTYWLGDALTEQTLDAFLATLGDGQIAICVQSFTATSVDVIRQRLSRQSF